MSLPLEGLKVLLVEDDFLILLDLKLMLEEAGAHVVTATSVEQGLQLTEEEYHAAILDIRLPDGDVFPVAERLEAVDTPIIFHSGNTDTSGVDQRFPQAIALAKPAHEQHLIDAVRRKATM